LTGDRTSEREAPRNVSIDDEDGERVVRIRHTVEDGQKVVIEQRFPDALSHLYHARGVNEEIPLYAGDFRLNDGSASGDFTGEVYFSWLPTPRTVFEGDADGLRIHDLLGDDSQGSHWSSMPTVTLPEDVGVPEAPRERSYTWDSDRRVYRSDRLGDQIVGDRSVKVDRLTFWIPNGWKGPFDASHVRESDRPWVWWKGRVEADVEEWSIKIDSLREADKKESWEHLRGSGGWRFTHVGELCRRDGETFNFEDVEGILHQIGLAITLTLGRQVRPLLPVGWLDGIPRWSSWRTGPVDRMLGVRSWSDQSIFAEQLSEVIEKVILWCRDPGNAELLQYSVSYYAAASFGSSAELGVALPLSALQMLAYDRFVEQRRLYTPRQWKDGLHTEEEIRLLLDDCGIDLEIPDRMEFLKSVSTALGPMPDGRHRDALRCIVDMRNVVIHPTRKKPVIWSHEQWVEASMIAVHLLELAMLNVIDYRGKSRSVMQPGTWLGTVFPVPWV
jgi:hypothetical protein